MEIINQRLEIMLGSKRRPRSAALCGRAFTLVEVLVVIAIIAILSALILPSVVRAKKEAKKAVAINNLRQCYLALSQYCDANDGWAALPKRELAIQMLPIAVTWDPSDDWRTSMFAPSLPDMVGSFGYVRYHLFDTNGLDWDPNWQSWVSQARGRNFTIMVSLYYSDLRAGPPGSESIMVHGDRMPDRVLALKSDGHIAMTAVKHRESEGLSWSALFFEIPYEGGG